MSNQLDPLSDSLNMHIIAEIDQLDLPIMQKHHVRILAHCLTIFKFITSENSSQDADILLREWCNNHSKKFDDQQFSELLYEQLSSTLRKLNLYSSKVGKNIEDLDTNDLVLLVKQREETY